MRALGDWVLRHRAVVVLFWLLVAVAGALNASRTVDRLSYDFALPGQAAYETKHEIARLTGGGVSRGAPSRRCPAPAPSPPPTPARAT